MNEFDPSSQPTPLNPDLLAFYQQLMQAQSHRPPMPTPMEGATPPDYPASVSTTLPFKDYGVSSAEAQAARGPAITPPGAPPDLDWYKYGILGSLLASAGAGLGQAFRRKQWGPPPPVPPPQFKGPTITAPGAQNTLTSLADIQRRKGRVL